MAKYRNFQLNFWQDNFVVSLSFEERNFYHYLITNPRTNQCGIYVFSLPFASLEFGLSKEKIKELLKKFVEHGKILYDEATEEVMVLNWYKYNVNSSRNTHICINKELKMVKTKRFVYKFYELCKSMKFCLDLIFDDIEIIREPLTKRSLEYHGCEGTVECQNSLESPWSQNSLGSQGTLGSLKPLESPGSQGVLESLRPVESKKSQESIESLESLESLKSHNSLESLESLESLKSHNPQESLEPQGSLVSKESMKELSKKPGEKKGIKDVIMAFDNNIHLATFMEIENLKIWYEELGGELVVLAINEATKNNVRNIKYINGILLNWKNNGLKTLLDVSNYMKNFRNSKYKNFKSNNSKYKDFKYSNSKSNDSKYKDFKSINSKYNDFKPQNAAAYKVLAVEEV